MAAVVRKAIADKRKELADKIDLLKEQMRPVSDDLLRRTSEIDAVQTDIAEIDSWLTANP
jgi:septal ring factor EnvC (AmiA/AmiB activator)